MSSREPSAWTPRAAADREPSGDRELRGLYERVLSDAAAAAAHPDEAAWERVLAGDATTDERRHVMEHVVACPACADLYRRLQIVRCEAATFDPGAPRVDRSDRSSSGWIPASSRRIAYAAAAAVLLAAVLVPLAWRAWRAQDSPSIANANSATDTSAARAQADAARLRENPAFRLEKPPIILSAALALTPRGAADDRQRLLAALGPALDAYRTDDLEKAARSLDAVSRTYPAVPEPALYAGISLLLLNRAGEAVPLLERARAQAGPELEREAAWPLSLAYVHAGDAGKARAPLQGLCSAAGEHQTRACEALRALPPSR